MVTAIHDMVNGSRVLKTQLARHEGGCSGENEISSIEYSVLFRTLLLIDLRMCGTDPFNVLQQLKSIPADSGLRSLAGAPDGKTVYYVAESTVWAASVQGGNPRKIREGDSVAPYPQGDALLVQLNQADGVRLVRVPLGGTPEEFLPTPPSPFRLVAAPLAPNAVGSDGRIALEVDPTNSWYWAAAILDSKTGTTELVSDIKADMLHPGWDDQGRVVIAAQFLRSSIWRFSAETQEARK
jgi:hypothetical protein